MDIKNYTDTELKEQLGLVELHVKQQGVDQNFCLSCISKHLDNISGLSKEGSSVKGNGARTYKKLIRWVDDLRDGHFNGVKDIAVKAREFRKSLENPEIAPVVKKSKRNFNKDFFMKAAHKRW